VIRKTLAVSLALVGCLSTTSVSAHEDGIYESLGHIPIGRVFLSPGERDQLDSIRMTGPKRASDVAPRVSQSARPKNNKAAGYIISNSGTARVWKNGDFVAVATPNVRFPGEIDVARKQKQPSQGHAPRDDDAPAAEAGDDPQ